MSTTKAMSISDVIKALQAHGETLETLATKIGVSGVSMWRWREKKAIPHKRDQKKLWALWGEATGGYNDERKSP